MSKKPLSVEYVQAELRKWKWLVFGNSTGVRVRMQPWLVEMSGACYYTVEDFSGFVKVDVGVDTMCELLVNGHHYWTPYGWRPQEIYELTNERNPKWKECADEDCDDED